MTIPARLFSSSVLLVAVCCVTLMSILNGIFLHHQIYINNIININNIDGDFVLNLQEKNSVGGNAPISTKPKFIVNNNDRDLEDNNMKLGSLVDDTTINSSNQHQQGQAMSSSKPRTVIFFNTYIHANRTLEGQKIIRDQLWRINKQPLLEDTDIYYTRFGDINTTAWPETECVGRRKKRKCHQIEAEEKGNEVDAIRAVYEYCLQNEEDRVVYMHSKGSFTPTKSNDRLRRFLMEAILSDECLNMPNDGSCSTCSTQFQPFPFFHYVGNMLVAECSYVKKLIPPKDFEKAKRRVVDTLLNATFPSLSLSTNITNKPERRVYITKIEGGDNPIEFQFRKKHVAQIQSDPGLGINRYAMEHYFLSHPEAKPCEVFSKMDPMTVPFSYNGIKTLGRNLYRIKKKILKPTLQKIPELVIEQNATDLILGNGFGYLHPFFLRNGRIFLYRALYPESMDALRMDSWLHVFLSNYSKFDDIGLTLRKRTVIFFNTYIHANRTLEGQKIIRDQLWRINKQPLLEDTDIYYTRFGDINTTAWPETECVGRRKKRKCHQIEAEEKGNEVDAIRAVYEYCLQNEEDRVVYMHSKGSFTPTKSNDRLRRFLMEAILSDECLNMPNDGSCSTCSTQFQPFPFFHYVGNMLVAECSYVKKLIPPKDFEKAKRRVVDTLLNATFPSLSLSTNITNKPERRVYITKIEGGDNPIEFQFRKKHVAQIQSDPGLGINRYAMEHYFLSHPEAKPCEVFSKMDPMTVPFSYNGIKTLGRNLYRIKKKILKPTLQKIPELVIEQNATDLILGNGFGYLHPFFLRNGRIFLYRALYPESMDALRMDSWLHVFLSNYSKFDDIGLTLRKIKFDDIDDDDFDQHDDDDDDDDFDQHDDDDDDFDQHGDDDDFDSTRR